MAEKINRREQVRELIQKGTMTKQEIAEEIDVSSASVSSQMTYLRWMGNFIKYDSDKILSFCTEEEYNEWQEELAANRKTKSASTRTPEEQAEATHKAIKRQNVQLGNWGKKLEAITRDLQTEPEDDELLELELEANANITLLKIKIRRNEAKAEQLPEYVEATEDDGATDAATDATEGNADGIEDIDEESLL